MIAHAFHHRRRAGVAHGKTLAGHAVEEGLAAGCAVQHDIADQNVLLGQKVESRGGYTIRRPPESPLPT